MLHYVCLLQLNNNDLHAMQYLLGSKLVNCSSNCFKCGDKCMLLTCIHINDLTLLIYECAAHAETHITKKPQERMNAHLHIRLEDLSSTYNH